MLPDENTRLLNYLNDALAAAQEVEINTLGLSDKNFYFNNIKWLVERGIEIISEALKRANAINQNLDQEIRGWQKFMLREIKLHISTM